MEITAEYVLSVIRNANIPDLDAESLNAEQTFSEQGVDSLDTMSILLALEDGFAVQIPDEDADQLRSIPDIVGYLKGRLA